MPTATLTSKGQITLPKEVRAHLHLTEGDRVEFLIEKSGDVRVRPIGGSVRELRGLIHVSGRPAPSLEELEDELTRVLGEDNERIRGGRA